MTRWMSSRVLEGTTIKSRALAIVRLVRLGVAFVELGNFNGVMQVVRFETIDNAAAISLIRF